MPMSFAGRVASSSVCVGRRKGRGTGWLGFDAPRQLSSPTGVYGTAAAEHREPCESTGSRTVLGAPGGEIPPGDSTQAVIRRHHQEGLLPVLRFGFVQNLLLNTGSSPMTDEAISALRQGMI